MRRLCIFFIFLFKSFQSNAEISISFCYEEWTPYAYTKDSVHTGYIIEQVAKGLQSQSITAEFFEYPFSRCILEVNKGKVDFALFVDYEENIKILEQKIVDWQLAVVSTNKALNKQVFLNSDGAGVIIANDYEYPDQMINLLKMNKKNLLPTSYFFTNEHEVRALFSLLTKEHADFMIADRVWSLQLIEKYNLPLFISDWDLITVPQYIGFSEFTPSDKVKLINSLTTSRFTTK